MDQANIRIENLMDPIAGLPPHKSISHDNEYGYGVYLSLILPGSMVRRCLVAWWSEHWKQLSHLHVTRLDFSFMIQFYVGGYCCRLSEAPFGMRCATNILNANKLDSCGDDQVLMVTALIYTQLFWANVRGTPSFVSLAH